MSNLSRFGLAGVAALSMGMTACNNPETSAEVIVGDIEQVSYSVQLGYGTVEITPDICLDVLSPSNGIPAEPQTLALSELVESEPEELWARQELRDWAFARATIDGCMQSREFFAYAHEIGYERKLYEQPIQIRFVLDCEVDLTQPTGFCTPKVSV
jgi:hypothetical protein